MFFLFTYCLNNKSHSEFGKQRKAAMSKRTEFNALKISLHLSQSNRSMPGLLSYSWDNVSAWKACNICNGETSESHQRNIKKKKKNVASEADSEQYWSNFWDCHQNTFIVCLYNCTPAVFSSELLSLSNRVLFGLNLFVWTSWQTQSPFLD